MMEPCFRRCDSPGARGRHLQASRTIRKDELVFCERPLLALQSAGNSHRGALVCRNCRAFVGGPDLALAVASGSIDRAHAYTQWKETIVIGVEGKLQEECMDMVPCRQECGELYCSEKCQQDHWCCGGHELLCTGNLPDSETQHPLIEFKVHAIKNNEIFLMVADMIAAVVSQKCRHLERNERNSNNTQTAGQIKRPDALLEPYLDFTQVPWWTVATAPLLASPMGFAEASALDRTLKRLCEESSNLLHRALVEDHPLAQKALEQFNYNSPHEQKDNNTNNLCSADFFGRIIGSFEQNAIGIRQRNPLCRDILLDQNLRSRNRVELIKCMERVGMVGDDDCCVDQDDKINEDEQQHDSEVQVATDGEDAQEKEQDWDYSDDEITTFLAGLWIHEGGADANLRTELVEGEEEEEEEENGPGDDLDDLFTPLDGTAMYSITCKMNHSCNPNVVVLYRTRGWGKDHPLVQHCIALRDIEPGEELCISYIRSDDHFEARQQAIANYGFTCSCDKCTLESSNLPETDSSGLPSHDKIDDDNLFGGGSDTEDDEDETTSISDISGRNENGERQLREKIASLDKSFNSISTIPLKCLAEASNFVVKVGASAIGCIQKDANPNIGESLKSVLAAVRDRDFIQCKIKGSFSEHFLFEMLQENGAWPRTEYRECYGCSAVAAAIGYAHEGNFISAQRMLDKACILGMPRGRIKDFFDFVERHAIHTAHGPIPPALQRIVPNYGATGTIQSKEALSQPIRYPVKEMPPNTIEEEFQSAYVSQSKPVVFRQLASDWPAITNWCHLHNIVRVHGHRMVPVEIGSMMDASIGMEEKLMTLEEFLTSYLDSSCQKALWPIQDFVCEKSPPSKQHTPIAYLAQHPLLNQIPALFDDVQQRPPLCGKAGPSHVNVWMGTAGTRTPLYFDSYDNLFVQIIGDKYVRIYGVEESKKLYVIRGGGSSDNSASSTQLQGNMSELDCEMEDFDEKHPIARDAKFVEVLMLPGDCLFIPCKAWHYVRSLSTSMSVNYWF